VSTSLRSARCTENELSARHVLIALPPSSAVNYVDELNAACRLWAGPLGNGSLVFTSSIGVYGESFGNIVNETFRVDTRTKRTSLMLAAEEAVLIRKGAVVRLAGLYTKDRGPHTFWLKNGTVDAAATGCINMLHYEDAASVAIAALEKAAPGGIYLASDDNPLTRRELCQAALDSGLFPTLSMPVFTSETGVQAKICDDSYTRTTLSWSPRYKSFGEYMTTMVGGKSYSLEPLINGKPRPSARALLEVAKKKEEKKSALWLPGDEDDLL